jgi:hypothetical protein
LYYGGGGAGSNGSQIVWGGTNAVPRGGIGGGGDGQTWTASPINKPGIDGTANTGGGAGGGFAGTGSVIAYGAAGGSGIVIISYAYP